MRLLINTKETFWANMLIMKTHQTLIVEIGLSVLNHPIQRDSDKNMNSFYDKHIACFILKRDVVRRSRGRDLEKCSLALLASSEASYSFYQQQPSYLGSYIIVLLHEIHI